MPRNRTVRAAVIFTAMMLATGGVVGLGGGVAGAAISVADLSTGATAQGLAESLVGGGLSVSNVTYTGNNAAAGTFTGGDTAIGFPNGIVLSSGRVHSLSDSPVCSRGVEGPNSCAGNTTAWGTSGDTDLSTLAGVGTNDAAVLEFDFVPQFPTVQFQYVFSSDEYSEYANSSFNDVFGFFVNGANCATVGTDPAVPVSVNTINGGNPLGTNAQRPELYRQNEDASLDTEMDGLTTVLQCNALVTPNATNHMKLAIADGTDASLDSNVFLQSGSLVSGTGISGSVSGGGQSGTAISVPPGAQVTGSATLTGVTAGTATGGVSYSYATGASCDTVVASGGTKTATGGVVPDADPVVLPGAGVYSLIASYGGDDSHNSASTACGDVTVTVTGGASPLVLDLAPATGSATVGTDYTFTVTATRGGIAQPGVGVFFSTVSGPDSFSGEGTTDSAGQVTFVVHGSGSGTDVLRASAADGETPVTSNDASVTWSTSATGVTVTGSADPPTITSGSAGRAHFVIANAGPGALTGAYVIVTVPAGITPVSASISQGGCSSFVGQFAICLIGTIPAGGSVAMDVIAQTPPGFPPTSSLGIGVSLVGTGIAPVSQTNGPAVTAATGDEAAGFVPPGGTISTGTNATPEHNTVASFRLPKSGSGAPIVLRAEADGTGTFCGGEPCSGKTIFLSPFSGYTNPKAPAVLKITWDKTVAGRGTKSKIYVQKVPGGPITRVPTCDNTEKHIAIPSPCIHEKEKLENGDIRFEILVLSNDPRFARR